MSRISTYEELKAERKRIEFIIAENKQVINDSISDLKQKVEPFLYLIPILNILKRKESGNSLLKGVANMGIDLVGNRLLSKAGWFLRLIIPMALKGVSAKAIDNSKQQA